MGCIVLLVCKMYFPVQQDILLLLWSILNLRNKEEILASLFTPKPHIFCAWITDRRSCTLHIWIYGLKITEIFKLSWKEWYVHLWKTFLSLLSKQILKITADGNSAIFQSSMIPRVGEFLILFRSDPFLHCCHQANLSPSCT